MTGIVYLSMTCQGFWQVRLQGDQQQLMTLCYCTHSKWCSMCKLW